MTAFESSGQQRLWDEMHGRTSPTGELVGRSLVNEPNTLARIVAKRLDRGARIIEVGSANGRDARYWAITKGMAVVAMDFSVVAIEQMVALNEQFGVSHRITPKVFDANTDTLPVDTASQQGFYARSSLHVPTRRISELLLDVHRVLEPGGLVAIEGKHPNDHKIARSHQVDADDPYLVADPLEEGHVRRVWEPESTAALLENSGFTDVDIQVITDQTDFTETSTFSRILAVRD